jgi:polar amino acid transport system substrate-binding protein
MTSLKTVVPGLLTVGTYAGFAPISFSKGDVAFGKDIQFLRAFATGMGLSLDVHFFEFERIWERPARGEIDIAAAGIQPFEQRHIPGVTWSRPYFTVLRSLVVRASEVSVLQSMADFAGRVIAVTRGSTADLDTAERKPDTARVVYFDRQESAIEEAWTQIVVRHLNLVRLENGVFDYISFLLIKSQRPRVVKQTP